MDSYTAKFQSMQLYVPFLNKMIFKIQQSGDKDKEPQLMKMRSLLEILINPLKKVRMETLLKCEEVLKKLYEKVEGVPFNSGAGARQTNLNRIQNEKPQQSRSHSPVQGMKQNLSDYLQTLHEQQHYSSREEREQQSAVPHRTQQRESEKKGSRLSPWEDRPSWEEKPDPWEEKPNPWEEKPKTWNDKPKPWEDKPNPWAEKPKRWEEKPNPWSEKPKPWANAPNAVVSDPVKGSSPDFRGFQGGRGFLGPGPGFQGTRGFQRGGAGFPGGRGDSSGMQGGFPGGRGFQGGGGGFPLGRGLRGGVTPGAGLQGGRGILGSGGEPREDKQGFQGCHGKDLWTPGTRDRGSSSDRFNPGLRGSSPGGLKGSSPGGFGSDKFNPDKASRSVQDTADRIPGLGSDDEDTKPEKDVGFFAKTLERGVTGIQRGPERNMGLPGLGQSNDPYGSCNPRTNRTQDRFSSSGRDEKQRKPESMFNPRERAKLADILDPAAGSRSPGERIKGSSDPRHRSNSDPRQRLNSDHRHRIHSEPRQKSSLDSRRNSGSLDQSRSSRDHSSHHSTPRSPEASSRDHRGHGRTTDKDQPKSIPLERTQHTSRWDRRDDRNVVDNGIRSRGSSWSPFHAKTSSPVRQTVSPDTQTVSPQNCSPDTQTASPDTLSSPVSSTLNRASSRTLTSSQDTPASPDTATSPGQNDTVSKSAQSPQEIPNIPVTAQNLPLPVPTARIDLPLPVPTVKATQPTSGSRLDPRKRDPRQRPPVNVVKPTSSTNPPAYMSNVGPGIPKNVIHPGMQMSMQGFRPGMPNQGPRPPHYPGQMGSQDMRPRFSGPKAPQPQVSIQPRNYREYRLMKEEQENKRREAEQKFREEMRKLHPKEEEKSEKEDSKNPPSAEVKITPTKPEEKPSTKGKVLDRPAPIQSKSKDPRKKAMDEKKAIELMKKSFKIPKMKKNEPIETIKDDNSKLKVIDMFDSVNKKTPEKMKMSESSSTPETKKENPKIALEENEKKDESLKDKVKDAQHEITNNKLEARLTSDSDSDHGLTIAEDLDDEQMDLDKQDTNPAASHSDAASKEVGEGKEELTKQLLKKIVANLDPSEAAKLLLKAQKLEKVEKLSLEQLKEFLFTPEEEEKKQKETKHSKKKSKKSRIAPNTRRSGRLQKDESDVSNEEDNIADPSESETETFVIEPKVMKQKKKRTKKGSSSKSKRIIEDEEEDEDNVEVQDDLVSSSNIDEVGVKATSEVLQSEPPELKVLIPMDKDLEESSSSTFSPKSNKKSKGGPAPKSKTWFPGDNRGTKKKQSLAALTSPPIIKADVTHEEKEADPKVFLGADENIEELLKTEFAFNPGKLDQKLTNSFKKRHETVSGLFNKLSLKIKQQNKLEASKAKDEPSELPLCSKIKLCRPITPETFLEPQLVKSIELTLPLEVKSKTESLIIALQGKLKQASKSQENVEPELPNLFDVVKDICRVEKKRRQAPPLLIPLSQTHQKIEVKKRDSGFTCGLGKYLPSLVTEFKSSKALLLQLHEDKVVCLFRCMSFNCSYATNSVDEFKSHLFDHVEDKFGSLRCSLCLGKASEFGKLIKHIVKKHGHDRFQCVYCFSRHSTRIDIDLHLNMFHPNLPPLHICCQHLPGADKEAIEADNKGLEEDVLNHPLLCPMVDCSFTCDASQPEELVHHISDSLKCSRVDLEEKMNEYLCPYCQYSNINQIPVLVHETLVHPGQEHQVLLRSTDLRKHYSKDNLSDTDYSSDCSTDSELSNFDAGFYDEDIESLELIERGSELECIGLSGHTLFKCANDECDFSAANVSNFKDHLLVCEFSSDSLYYTCIHCRKQFKHPPTLLEHMKSHAVRRFFCSLCDYKNSVLQWTKSHMRQHKVTNIKLVPVLPNRSNADEDCFVLVPKNTVPKGPKSKVSKDTFGIQDIDMIASRPEVCRNFLRCAVCDFSTKVRRNLMRHLNMHRLRQKQYEEGEIREIKMSVVCPVNPPVNINNGPDSNYSKMQSLLGGDEDDEWTRQPMSDEELALMPRLIPENVRYACGMKDCKYITIDEVMLQYHIQALHADCSVYTCPHCSDVTIPLDAISFHLRCHGELLFKCGNCAHYHWQKRTAEKHAAHQHPDKKLFVRNVRAEEEEKKETKKKKKKETVPSKPEPVQLSYLPFKCGICDYNAEVVVDILEHCATVHELNQQYKCAFCTFSSNNKVDIEKHFPEAHKLFNPTVLKMYFVDPSTCTQDADSATARKPLWSREMEGLKHIRGILYDENSPEPKPSGVRKPKREKFELNIDTIKKEPEMDSTLTKQEAEFMTAKPEIESGPTKQEIDFYPMQCRVCEVDKKNISGLKLHIKLVHLKQGKYHCLNCDITANLKQSIISHVKKFHSSSLQDKEGEGWEERNEDPETFTQEYWRDEWNIPTVSERRALLQPFSIQIQSVESLNIKREPTESSTAEMSDSGPSAKKPKLMKRGRKRKPAEEVADDGDDEGLIGANTAKMPLIESYSSIAADPMVHEMTARPLEMSPFEKTQSFMCSFCPKRSQCLERLRNHHEESHSKLGFEYRELSRDQVVHIITSDQTNYGAAFEYKCFYCQETGDIQHLRVHTDTHHSGQTFRVTKCQNKGVSGYLECQLCGHLSPGFEKSKQKAHFHEEHPFQTEVTCSKYMFKHKLGPDAFTSSQQAFKFDVRDVEGIEFTCPKVDECSFSTKSLSQMNNHLRKHTRTYKCGHCGKTLPDSSEFHRHSALSHGDKIPDLVKDPEAEAEYEALKGILEYGIQRHLEKKKQKVADLLNQTTTLPRLTARKSMGPGSKAGPGDMCRNIARKSTGAQAKYWKETRLKDPYSFYLVPQQPIDRKQVNTKMAIGGGMEITLDVEKMSQLVNLDAFLVLNDCVKVSLDREELDL